jgi:carbon storage regulator
MLVLSRKIDESIVIGDDVEITIVEVRGDTVKLGVSAPKSVTVYRKEVYEAIQQENIAASKPAAQDLSAVAKALRKKKDADSTDKDESF